jgi:hypothetical protein
MIPPEFRLDAAAIRAVTESPAHVLAGTGRLLEDDSSNLWIHPRYWQTDFAHAITRDSIPADLNTCTVAWVPPNAQEVLLHLAPDLMGIQTLSSHGVRTQQHLFTRSGKWDHHYSVVAWLQVNKPLAWNGSAHQLSVRLILDRVTHIDGCPYKLELLRDHNILIEALFKNLGVAKGCRYTISFVQRDLAVNVFNFWTNIKDHVTPAPSKMRFEHQRNTKRAHDFIWSDNTSLEDSITCKALSIVCCLEPSKT